MQASADADRGEHLRRPAPPRLVEELGAGGVGHVGGELAGEVKAHIVLGEEDVGDAGEQLRLMGADPEELGRGETGHWLDAGDGRRDRARRGRAPRIPHVPRASFHSIDRTEHAHVGVEQHGGVHLAGQADGLDRPERPAARREGPRSSPSTAAIQWRGSCSLHPGSGREVG